MRTIVLAVEQCTRLRRFVRLTAAATGSFAFQRAWIKGQTGTDNTCNSRKVHVWDWRRSMRRRWDRRIVCGNGAMVKVKTAQGPLDKAALRIPSCTKMGAITNAVQKWEFLGSTRPNTWWMKCSNKCNCVGLVRLTCLSCHNSSRFYLLQLN